MQISLRWSFSAHSRAASQTIGLGGSNSCDELPEASFDLAALSVMKTTRGEAALRVGREQQQAAASVFHAPPPLDPRAVDGRTRSPSFEPRLTSRPERLARALGLLLHGSFDRSSNAGLVGLRSLAPMVEVRHLRLDGSSLQGRWTFLCLTQGSVPIEDQPRSCSLSEMTVLSRLSAASACKRAAPTLSLAPALTEAQSRFCSLSELMWLSRSYAPSAYKLAESTLSLAPAQKEE